MLTSDARNASNSESLGSFCHLRMNTSRAGAHPPAGDAMIAAVLKKSHVSRTSPRTANRKAQAIRGHVASPRALERPRLRSRHPTQGENRRSMPVGFAFLGVSRTDEARPGFRGRDYEGRADDTRGVPGGFKCCASR